MLFPKLVIRCTLKSFLGAHPWAFHNLGGTSVSYKLLYDSPCPVFTGHRRGLPANNSEFAHIANHRGLKPVVCSAYSLWDKVEGATSIATSEVRSTILTSNRSFGD
jgi:hypothetical protein